MTELMSSVDYEALATSIKQMGESLGFQQVAIAGISIPEDEQHLQAWLARGFQGEMSYMAAHGEKRSRPELLEPATVRVISFRMDYLPDAADPNAVLADGQRAYISRYANGRDYHKLMRKRLAKIAAFIAEQTGSDRHRAFVDSAPVLERALAQQAGLGWIGKNTMLINSDAGSWFFLGEIYTDAPLPIDPPQATQHCGSCHACLDICPTQAFDQAWILDARRCISYLTIELHGSIPVEFRQAIGNRIYGCDDCQLVCPWNKFARLTELGDFQPRHQLDNISLLKLFAWDEHTFLNNTEGSAIRRIGYQRWLRNIAVALGNAAHSAEIIKALQAKRPQCDAMVQEHIDWALQQQHNSAAG